MPQNKLKSSKLFFVDKIYLGADNSLVLSKKVYVEYGCTFDLHDFPFDEQKCKMNFAMASAKDTYIVLTTNRDSVKYHVSQELYIPCWCSRGGRNKNRLSSTTCGEELQKIFKDWQIFKGFCQKAPKKFTDFKRFAFLTFFDL